MTTTKKKTSGPATTFHRDGTVTYWDVYAQAWARVPAEEIGDATLATLPRAERERVARMVARGREVR